jgi:hypothetical protein
MLGDVGETLLRNPKQGGGNLLRWFVRKILATEFDVDLFSGRKILAETPQRRH